jgi:hypothetical protein
MALELLSGPHTVVDGRTGANVTGMSQFEVAWIDPAGLLAPASGGYTYLVQMDGTAFDFTVNINNFYYGLALLNATPTAPLVGDPWYSVILANGSSTTPASEWALDRVTHVYGALLTTNAPGDQLGPYAHVHDRYLRTLGGRVDYTANAADTWHTEATISGFANGAFLSWARERGHLWLAGTTGYVVRYDYINKVASSPVYRIGLSSALTGLFYSAKHDVFVSIHQIAGDARQMQVWARTPLPVSVSAPAATPAVAAGHASTLTVRVLGGDSDPCPHEAVAWALTGEGTLDRAVTATDENGYATNRLVLPVGATGPSVRIDVEVSVP